MENYDDLVPEPDEPVNEVVAIDQKKMLTIVIGMIVVSTLPLIGFYFGSQYGMRLQQQLEQESSVAAPVENEVTDSESPQEQAQVVQVDGPEVDEHTLLTALTMSGLKDGVVDSEEVQLSWTVDSGVLASFPAKNTYVAFTLYDAAGNEVATIGDGFLLSGKTSYTDTIADWIRNGFVNTADSYVLKAALVVQPTDFDCDPTVVGECVPVYGEEDNRLRKSAQEYSYESAPFKFDSALWENVNQKSSVRIDGPTEVLLGEESVWTAVVQNDGDDSVALHCYVSRWQTELNDVQVGPDGLPASYTSSDWNEALDTSGALPGDVVSLVWVPTETTGGDTYFEISCTPWEENGSLPGSGDSLQFEVVE